MRLRRLLPTSLAAAGLLVQGGAVAAPPTVDVIVVLEDTDAPRAVANDVARAHAASLTLVYEHALDGFAASLPPGRVRALGNDPRVVSVESDDLVQVDEQDVPTGIDRVMLDRQALDVDGVDDVRVDVDVAVIDTGIDLEHPDLSVAGGVTCSSSGSWRQRVTSCVAGGDDDHYHGTHVAGTVAALDDDQGVVGVAPGARLWAVKVLDASGSGSESQVVAGIDWVAANADTIEVANMSLGGAGYSAAEEAAIQGAVDRGVAFAVAAGNDADDAAGYSPASFDDVLTVSALADFDGRPGALGSSTCRIDRDDTLADFSNYGADVDVAAPGVCITSTFPLEQGGYGTISGTSMASPHVAGALALLASEGRATSASGVRGLYDRVVAAGNQQWTDDSGDATQEPLLDVGGFTANLVATGDGGAGGGDPEPEPAAIDLELGGSKQRGRHVVEARWSGASGASVDVVRDGAVVATTGNDGVFVDRTGQKGGRTYAYRVCEAGTSTCSPTVRISF